MLDGVLTGLLFALGATVLNSVAGLLQSDATRRVSEHRSLIAQPRYLGGLGVDALGWVCTVVALRQLPVFAVQAVLGGSIALTAVLARMVYGSALRTVDRVVAIPRKRGDLQLVDLVLGPFFVPGSGGGSGGAARSRGSTPAVGRPQGLALTPARTVPR
jgi:hypothetical protein